MIDTLFVYNCDYLNLELSNIKILHYYGHLQTMDLQKNKTIKINGKIIQ